MPPDCHPVILPEATVPGAIPCFVLCEGAVEGASGPSGPRRVWDRRCTRLLERFAARRTNAEAAELIAAVTGSRFKDKTISEYRASLGLESPRRNDWTAPLRRWRPWSTARAD